MWLTEIKSRGACQLLPSDEHFTAICFEQYTFFFFAAKSHLVAVGLRLSAQPCYCWFLYEHYSGTCVGICD